MGIVLSNSKVCVTGADGFIGSHLVEVLVAAGADVRALAFYNSFGSNGWLDSLAGNIRKHVAIERGDIRDPYLVDQFIEGADVVLHLAALVSIPYSYVAPQSYIDVNVTGTVNVLQAVRRHEPALVIHTSTSEVYGTALFTPITEKHSMQGQSPYSASKIAADHFVESYSRSFNLPAVVLRPFNTYGPRQSERAVIPTIIRQTLDKECESIRLGDLSPIRDFSFVGDTANAYLKLAEAENVRFGEAYNMGSGIGTTIGSVADLVRTITGCDKPIVEDHDRKRPKKSEVFELLASNERLTTVSDWSPQVTLLDGLKRTVDWWRIAFAEGNVRRDKDYLV